MSHLPVSYLPAPRKPVPRKPVPRKPVPRTPTPHTPARMVAVFWATTCMVMFGILTALVVLDWPPLTDTDTSVLLALRGLAARHGWLDAALTVVSTVLGPWVFRVVAAIAGITLLAAARWRAPTSRHRALRCRLALFILVTVAVGGMFSAGVKVAVSRDRPPVTDALADASGMSYPSGHAVGVTVAVAVMLGVITLATGRRPPMWLATTGFLAVATVGLSRLALGVHYLSDVLGGCLLGLAWVAGAIAAVHPPPASSREGSSSEASPSEASPSEASARTGSFPPAPVADRPRT